MVEPIEGKEALDAILKKLEKLGAERWTPTDNSKVGSAYHLGDFNGYKTLLGANSGNFDVVIYRHCDSHELAVLRYGLDVVSFRDSNTEESIAVLYSNIHQYHEDKRQKREEQKKIANEHAQKLAISDLEKELGLDKVLK